MNTDKPSAVQRIQELSSGKGMTGSKIAQALFDEGYDINDADAAFNQLGHVTCIYPFMKDVYELHVSDKPMEAGLATIILSTEPRTMPSVVWRKRECTV